MRLYRDFCQVILRIIDNRGNCKAFIKLPRSWRVESEPGEQRQCCRQSDVSEPRAPSGSCALQLQVQSHYSNPHFFGRRTVTIVVITPIKIRTRPIHAPLPLRNSSACGLLVIVTISPSKPRSIDPAESNHRFCNAVVWSVRAALTVCGSARVTSPYCPLRVSASVLICRSESSIAA
jgi:hypothetical protein